MRTIFVFLIILVVGENSVAQKPDFKVLAIYNEYVKSDHQEFAKELIAFLSDMGDKNNFTLDVKGDDVFGDSLLVNYQVVLWINNAPYPKKARQSFERYMENGGGWIGFHEVWPLEKGDTWPWLNEFLGTSGYRVSRPALPVRLSIDDSVHPVTQNLPPFMSAPPNEWFQWVPNPRENKNVKVLVTLDPMNYPLGIDNILTGGDAPVVWTNTKYNMVYLNLGHDRQSMTDRLQNILIADALMWVAKKSVKKGRQAMAANTNLPEMVKVQGGGFTMGDDTGANDEKPAHPVTVSSFSIARTETTIGQWRNFCLSTGRKMPEEPWFKQNDQHPVVNVSWDNAVAYCLWLSDVTGKPYRLPTEAEWEFAARGGVKSMGFPYSGGKNADSVAWLAHKTEGTMPVAQKAPNELGLYDMTGNVWEWCSDWYDAGYYAVSVKDNPRGPQSGKFYTFRGGAWDIGARNNRVSYRNPLGPTSRNHNKGFRVACE